MIVKVCYFPLFPCIYEFLRVFYPYIAIYSSISRLVIGIFKFGLLLIHNTQFIEKWSLTCPDHETAFTTIYYPALFFLEAKIQDGRHSTENRKICIRNRSVCPRVSILTAHYIIHYKIHVLRVSEFNFNAYKSAFFLK